MSKGCAIPSKSTDVKKNLTNEDSDRSLAVPKSLSCICSPALPPESPAHLHLVTLSTPCPRSLPPALRPSSCPQGSHSSTHSLTTCDCFLGVSLRTEPVRPEVWHGVYRPQLCRTASQDAAQAASPPPASCLLTSSKKDSRPMQPGVFALLYEGLYILPGSSKIPL